MLSKRFRGMQHLESSHTLSYLTALLMAQDLRQKVFAALVLGVVEELVRGVFFDNLTLIHKDDAVGHGLGKPHFTQARHRLKQPVRCLTEERSFQRNYPEQSSQSHSGSGQMPS